MVPRRNSSLALRRDFFVYRKYEMTEYQLIMPDGAQKIINEGVTPLDIAKEISPSLAKKSVIAKIDQRYVGMHEPITASGDFKLVTQQEPEALDILRHSTSHLLAQALRRIYPEIKLGVGPFIENGFYYDTDNLIKSDKQVSIDDFEKIEAEMQKIVKEDWPIVNSVVSRKEALEIFKDDPYKMELINDLPEDEIITIAKQGEFTDLDRGGLVPSTGWIKYFKLSSVAGAYWRGKSDNQMMQRIYGISEWSAKDVEEQVRLLEERKERDHRTIGRDMDLFFVDPENIGAGLPVWMPNGSAIRRTIEDYIVGKETLHGYQHVYTPVVSNLELYKRSGHWDHYREDMFPPMIAEDGEELQLRPMNCPSHIAVYQHHPRSYRDLPFRIAEFGQMHRWEKSGALTGLSRVREMTLNDGHTVVAPDQIQDEFQNILKIMMEVYDDFNIKDYRFRLSYRDPQNTEKYFDDDQMWITAQQSLKDAMDNFGLEYFEAEGEAAFYGPKLDVQVKTALGNEETLSTIQLDFLLPERFNMEYVGQDGQMHRPVLMHRGIVGTMERFIAYIIEQTKGAFPTWLAPTQVIVIPVSQDRHDVYSREIVEKLLLNGVRAKLETRSEKMGYLIRDAQTNKIPYTLVIGDAEVDGQLVSVRKYGQEETKTQSYQQFAEEIRQDITNYSRV